MTYLLERGKSKFYQYVRYQLAKKIIQSQQITNFYSLSIPTSVTQSLKNYRNF